MRLQEIHPSLVHMPLALLPLGLAADVLGELTGSDDVLAFGRIATVLAGVTGLAAATSGLVAQSETDAQGEVHDLLVSHRTLEATTTLSTLVLAVLRGRRKGPSTATLLLGTGSLGIALWGALLGGKLVYEHGLGVAREGETAPPEVRDLPPRELVRRLRKDIVDALHHAWKHAREGKILPTTGIGRDHGGGAPDRSREELV